MKYKKGELFCAVLNCTSRDYSSARSLLEFKPQVVTVFSNEKKEYRINLIRYSPTKIRTEWIPNEPC